MTRRLPEPFRSFRLRHWVALGAIFAAWLLGLLVLTVPAVAEWVGG